MSAHSLGPWRVMTNSDDQMFILGPDSPEIVAELDGNWPEPMRSNARLIAAAPELLEALIALHPVDSCTCPDLKTQGIVHAAIKKARGES